MALALFAAIADVLPLICFPDIDAATPATLFFVTLCRHFAYTLFFVC